jgi:soluble lytic murein transglycosylase
VALLAAVLASCGDQPPASQLAPAATAPETTPGLLPTPTLAAGVVVPRPPTPVVLPSPTPLGGAIAPEPTTATERAAEVSLESVELPVSVSVPDDATASDLLAIGERLLAEGDFAGAAGVFQAASERAAELTPDQVATARYRLGFALLQDGRPALAAAALDPLVTGEEAAPPDVAAAAAFQRAQTHLAANAPAEAIAAFEQYLAENPDMAAYVQPLIAEARKQQGDTAGAIAALEAALAAPSHRLSTIAIHRQLADSYLAGGEYAAAVAQYDAIHDLARTEITRGEMTYLAGQAELQAGNTAAAHERFLKGMTDYPRAIESYWGLVALVEAGVEVDEFQRGLVDYYAAVYQPAVEAFERAITDASDDYRRDTHLYLAWSHEGLGALEAALAELDKYAAFEPAVAAVERAALLARAGDVPAAIAAYETFITDFPEHERAPEAAWDVAALAEKAGEANAADRYLYLAENYPFHADAAEAISRAAYLSRLAGDNAREIELWQRLADQYPQSIFGSEALVWLLQLAEEGTADLDLTALQEQARALMPTHYFAIRARDVANGVAPFDGDAPFNIPTDETAAQAEAEAWLRNWLVTNQVTVPPEGDLSALPDPLRDDPRRIVGEKLWSLGLLQEAQGEWEAFRLAYEDDPLASYQIAIYLRDMGLYRSSIAAAETLLASTGTLPADAPPFIGRLIYPVYYADLIVPLAEEYGFDPRLQFALVRQESLFESFARSFAAAQGLAQVIPDTGAWIAQRLAWPDFENEDLYKPYVGLRFGAYYLSQQLAAFDGLVQVALAAYNGGPGNAARWYEIAGDDYDLFVDTVDFAETRQYVQRIYQGFTAYRQLYGE